MRPSPRHSEPETVECVRPSTGDTAREMRGGAGGRNLDGQAVTVTRRCPGGLGYIHACRCRCFCGRWSRPLFYILPFVPMHMRCHITCSPGPASGCLVFVGAVWSRLWMMPWRLLLLTEFVR